MYHSIGIKFCEMGPFCLGTQLRLGKFYIIMRSLSSDGYEGGVDPILEGDG